jgi:hypothetical protein
MGAAFALDAVTYSDLVDHEVARITHDLAKSDQEVAFDLLMLVIGRRGIDEYKSNMLDRAHDALLKLNVNWTRRRVETIFHKQAKRIDRREVAEMAAVIKKARANHAAYREETARIAALVDRPKAD